MGGRFCSSRNGLRVKSTQGAGQLRETSARRTVDHFRARVDDGASQQRGIDSRDRLQALGHVVDWHSYPMAHAVCAEEIADLRRWLGARLAA